MTVSFSPETQPLIEQAQNSRRRARSAAYQLLTENVTPEKQAALQHLLYVNEGTDRYWEVIHAMAKADLIDPLPYFRKVLLQPDTSANYVNQRLALDNIRPYLNSEGIEILYYALLRYSRLSHVARIVRQLYDVRDDLAVYILARVIRSFSHWGIQQRAIAILGRTGDARAIDILLTVLEDDTQHVDICRASLHALSSLLFLHGYALEDEQRFIATLLSVMQKYPRLEPFAMGILEGLKSNLAEHLLIEFDERCKGREEELLLLP